MGDIQFFLHRDLGRHTCNKGCSNKVRHKSESTDTAANNPVARIHAYVAVQISHEKNPKGAVHCLEAVESRVDQSEDYDDPTEPERVLSRDTSRWDGPVRFIESILFRV